MTWGLLFDCDGTLVDSEPLLADALADTFTAMGLPFTADDYLHRYRGTRFHTILERLEAFYQRPAQLDRPLNEVEADMRVALLSRIEHSLKMIEGVPEALEALQKFPCGVASNGPLSKIRLSMRVSGLANHFGEHLYSAYEVGHWKPDPGLFLAAANGLGVPPARCIVIDDAQVGVDAGLAAGMQVIHYLHHPDEPTSAGAHRLLHTRDLPALVATLTAR